MHDGPRMMVTFPLLVMGTTVSPNPSPVKPKTEARDSVGWMWCVCVRACVRACLRAGVC